jgi:dTDP-glucose 4,6-dehydratase
MRVLVTGGAGFIGSTLVLQILRSRPDWEILNLDALTYAGSLDNLGDAVVHRAHRFEHGDICDRERVRELMRGVNLVFNLAAESHVDRSIADDEPFWRTNVLGTQVLFTEARAAGVRRFIQVSTDEVYGELPWRDPESRTPGPDGDESPGWRPGADGLSPAEDAFTEESPLRPRSPYAASKAAADLLLLAQVATHGADSADAGGDGAGEGRAADDGGGRARLPDVVIARGSNCYGPRQHDEKLIPTLVRHALTRADLPLYGDGLHVRDWMHVDDFCEGLLALARGGRPGAVYNFGGAGERTNRQVARAVLGAIGTHCAPTIGGAPDRPGHDRRYAVDYSRAREELDWVPETPFEQGLPATVAWYSAREDGTG